MQVLFTFASVNTIFKNKTLTNRNLFYNVIKDSCLISFIHKSQNPLQNLQGFFIQDRQLENNRVST